MRTLVNGTCFLTGNALNFCGSFSSKPMHHLREKQQRGPAHAHALRSTQQGGPAAAGGQLSASLVRCKLRRRQLAKHHIVHLLGQLQHGNRETGGGLQSAAAAEHPQLLSTLQQHWQPPRQGRGGGRAHPRLARSGGALPGGR